MKDRGFLKYSLVLNRNASGPYLNQRKYAFDIISETGLSGAKPTATPIERNHHLATTQDPFFASPHQYQHLIGHLYISLLLNQNLHTMFIFEPNSCTNLDSNIGMRLFM